MTEKEDDIASQTSSNTSFKPIIEPAKSAMVPPYTRPIMSIRSAQTSFDEQPVVKEGFNYWTHLPYPVEDEATRIAHLDEIIEDLYTYIKAGDFEGGARTASRQIKRWLHLKFKMPKITRKKLVELYYKLSLTPGIDASAADTFANMFRLLASYRSLVIYLNVDRESCLRTNLPWTGVHCMKISTDISSGQTQIHQSTMPWGKVKN